MAKVPACYVKPKRVDFDGEALQFLGAGLPLPGLTLPPPVLGVFPMLELFTSRYFLDPLGCAPEDIAKGLYVFAHREKALPLVAEACRGGSAFGREAGKWFLRHSDAITANYPEIVRYTLHLPFEGFDLLPTETGGPEKAFIFDAEWLAAVAGTVAMTTGDTLRAVLWEMPLEAVGHVLAFRARYEGRKGVGRKDDLADLDRIMKEADAREERGELHPWQIDHPERYGLSEKQVNARLGIVAEYQELLRKKQCH